MSNKNKSVVRREGRVGRVWKEAHDLGNDVEISRDFDLLINVTRLSAMAEIAVCTIERAALKPRPNRPVLEARDSLAS
jgi:hypothetical protein